MEGKLYHIGRDKTKNEIYIIDPSVQPTHAQLVLNEQNELIIIDLSTPNGVRVNNEKILAPVMLKQDDIITIGSFKCMYGDLLSAIRRYDFELKNQVAVADNQITGEPEDDNALKGLNTTSVQLVSSLLTGTSKKENHSKAKKSWHQNKKFLWIILSILIHILLLHISLLFKLLWILHIFI